MFTRRYFLKALPLISTAVSLAPAPLKMWITQDPTFEFGFRGADPNLDAINVITTKEIMPGIVDGFFRSEPIITCLKEKL